MSLYIQKFIDKLQHYEGRGVTEFSCPISDAKNLHSEITKLLLDIANLRDQTSVRQSEIQQSTNSDIVIMEIQGGSFKA